MVGSTDNVVLRGWLEGELARLGVQPAATQNRVWATTDHGSNIVKACRESECTQHVPCFSHVANRAICATIEAVRGGDLLQKVVTLAAYFN